MTEEFDAGAEAGRDLGRQAIDCPYSPADQLGQRAEWLKGFSAARPEVSGSSDPAHVAGAREPDEPAVSRGNTPHAG